MSWHIVAVVFRAFGRGVMYVSEGGRGRWMIDDRMMKACRGTLVGGLGDVGGAYQWRFMDWIGVYYFLYVYYFILSGFSGFVFTQWLQCHVIFYPLPIGSWRLSLVAFP